MSDAPPLAFDRVIYAHLQVLRGNYADALATLDASIPRENESTSIVVPMFALSGKTLALLHSGRLGELVQLLRSGRDLAEAKGNDPWLFVSREAWLRTAVLDFAGARDLCEGMAARSAAFWRGPSQSIGGVASGYVALEEGRYDDASRSFARVLDPAKNSKFFLHWYWRMIAQLGLTDVWLASGKLRKARLEADRFLQSALATAEPNLHALAWDVDARVAMAEKDAKTADEKIEKGLAVLQAFEIPRRRGAFMPPDPTCTDRRKMTPRRKCTARVPRGSSSPWRTRSRPTTPCALHSSPPHRFGGSGCIPRDPTQLDLGPHAVTTSHGVFGTKGHTPGEDRHPRGVLIDARANRFLTVF